MRVRTSTGGRLTQGGGRGGKGCKLNQIQARGKRVLLVEDEIALVLSLQLQLREMGFQVIGPAATLHTGLDLAEREDLDGALLDVNLRGERSFPIAERLRARGVPVIIMTGYGRAILPHRLRALPFLAKPFAPDELEIMVRRVFRNGAAVAI